MHREIDRIKSRIKMKRIKNISLNSNGSTNMKSNNKINLNKITCHPISKHIYKIINNSLLSLHSKHTIKQKIIEQLKIKIKIKRKIL